MSADRDKIFDELVDLVYAAAVELGEWRPFLDKLVSLHPGSIASVFLNDSQAGSYNFLASDSAFGASGYVESYLQHYAGTNVWMKNVASLPRLRANHSDEIIQPDDLAKTEFYNDWLRPQKLDTSHGIVLAADDNRFMVMSLLHGDSVPDRETETAVMFSRLIPHFQRAAQLHRKIAQISVVKESADSALDQVRFGVIFADQHARLVQANRAAKTLLDARDGIALNRAGTLRVTDHRAQARFAELIASALGRTGNGSGGVMSLPRPGRQPLLVMVAPLRNSANWHVAGIDATIGIFINDPEAPTGLTAGNLQAAFHLTGAEARLFQALADGKTLEEYADEAVLSRHTVRGYLKTLFQKMDCSRQSDLVRKASGLSSILHNNSSDR